MKFVGVILAGGESKRFGPPKAFAEKEEKAFYMYSMEALKPYVSQLLIVTSSELEPIFFNENLPAEIIRDVDKFRKQGPLGGIYTAMDQYVGEWYMVIPIDVPFIERKIMATLMKNIEPHIDAVIPVVSGKIQPLISIFHYNVKSKIKRNLNNNRRSVQKLLDVCMVKYVPIDEAELFVNINSQVDYQKYIEKSKD